MFVVREAQVEALSQAQKRRWLRELAREVPAPQELVFFCAASAEEKGRTQRALVRELVEIAAAAAADGATREEALHAAWAQVDARESYERYQALRAEQGR